VNLAIFVWTFSGIVNAIEIGIVLLAFLVIGLLLAYVKIAEWWKDKTRRKK
jgi:flagellar biosynthesis protein FliP